MVVKSKKRARSAAPASERKVYCRWRESIGIKSIYSEMDPPALSIKSVDRAEIPIRLTFS